MAVGSFRRLEEVGRGSFATVYKGSMSVSRLSNPFRQLAIGYQSAVLLLSVSFLLLICSMLLLSSFEEALLMFIGVVEEAWLCRHQVC